MGERSSTIDFGHGLTVQSEPGECGTRAAVSSLQVMIAVLTRKQCLVLRVNPCQASLTTNGTLKRSGRLGSVGVDSRPVR